MFRQEKISILGVICDAVRKYGHCCDSCHMYMRQEPGLRIQGECFCVPFAFRSTDELDVALRQVWVDPESGVCYARPSRPFDMRAEMLRIGRGAVAEEILQAEAEKESCIKLFVSLPMRGRTDDEIRAEMEKARQETERFSNKPVELLDTVFDLPEDASPLEYLSKSLGMMSRADLVYFAEGWQNARGCLIEWMCAREYGLTRYEATDFAEALKTCPVCGKGAGWLGSEVDE